MAQHAEEDGLQQPAIGGREHAAVGVALDERLGVVVAFGPGAQCGDGGLADEMDSTNRQSGSGPLPLRSQTVAFPSGWGMATDNAGR